VWVGVGVGVWVSMCGFGCVCVGVCACVCVGEYVWVWVGGCVDEGGRVLSVCRPFYSIRDVPSKQPCHNVWPTSAGHLGSGRSRVQQRDLAKRALP
jgi:hypothetical protein